MITLALDASTYVGDVAILDGARVLAEESVAMRGAEHERLMPAVATVLARACVDIDSVGRVVCGAGPGSFTSLRIAGAIAKGIASGVRIPLFALPSMALMVAGADLAPGKYLTVVDALRGEAYIGLYEVRDSEHVSEIEPARLVPAVEAEEIAAEYGARTMSPSRELASILAHPRAKAVARLGAWLDARGSVDLASWEPSYGRLAEAQVRWESAHGKPLPAG
jgi:tRNA threonylcarbamoyladenosine biosynthesis protein TsaB